MDEDEKKVDNGGLIWNGASPRQWDSLVDKFMYLRQRVSDFLSMTLTVTVSASADWTSRPSDIHLPVTSSSRSPARSVAASLDLDGIMAKIDSDNKILAELDKNRSNIGEMHIPLTAL